MHPLIGERQDFKVNDVLISSAFLKIFPPRNGSEQGLNCPGSQFLERDLAVELFQMRFFGVLSPKSEVPSRSIMLERRKTGRQAGASHQTYLDR